MHWHSCQVTILVNDQNKLLQIKEELSQKFEMKDLAELHFFLGMEVERSHDEQLLRINQIKYLKEILKRFRMEECKLIRVTFNPKVKLQRNVNGNDESKGFPYQQAVGFLMYAMLCRRPDLAYPISMLSQHMANPNMEYWMVVKRIFRYLQGTLQMNYNLVQHHPRKFLDIAMQIGVVILKIGGPPQGLFS
jgi:hypothetical protein